MKYTFTGTVDEEWFYLISVAIEAKGGPGLRAIVDALNAVSKNNIEKVMKSLVVIKGVVDEITGLLERMYEKVR